MDAFELALFFENNRECTCKTMRINATNINNPAVWIISLEYYD
jgi:hypothetical protein